MSSSPTNQIERNRGTADRQSPVCARRMMSAKFRARCPYTPRDLAGHYDPNAQLHICTKCGGRHEASTDYYPHKSTGGNHANSARHHWNGEGKRCAICDGRFGLIRHYAFRRTALCSRKCADRFKVRRNEDRRSFRAGLKAADDWDALHPAIQRNRELPPLRAEITSAPLRPAPTAQSDTVYCFALGGPI